MFDGAGRRVGLYESFYLRAFSPVEPLGVWIRYTAHKRPGAAARGSIWWTLFDARRPSPLMHKLTTGSVAAEPGRWISVGEEAWIGPAEAVGACGPARWSLRFRSVEAPLRHLTPALLYRAPLPRTKLTSPLPRASFDGTLAIAGQEPLELSGWSGMVGHNWGAEHAERWIWIHGTGFDVREEAWIDVALGRVMLAGRMTPWVANGALSLDGVRRAVGGLTHRPREVREHPHGCLLSLAGPGGLTVEVRASCPAGAVAGWRYADPDGGEHDALNCSIAALEIDVRERPSAPAVRLRSDHGGAYELGLRERDHGVEIAPFPDG
jgi:hypothetical protein